MLSRTLNAFQVSHTQLRKASNFNKYPALKVKPFGVGGNAMIAIGTTVLTISMIATYQAGFLVPKTPGMFWSPVGKIQFDLTPDELKENQN